MSACGCRVSLSNQWSYSSQRRLRLLRTAGNWRLNSSLGISRPNPLQNLNLRIRCSSSPSSSPPSATTPFQPPLTRLFVTGLSFRTTEESLRNAFRSFGELVEVKLVMDKVARRPRGFAFLSYATPEESQNAIQGMHGKFLDGRVIFVEFAKPRAEQKPKSNLGKS